MRAASVVVELARLVDVEMVEKNPPSAGFLLLRVTPR